MLRSVLPVWRLFARPLGYMPCWSTQVQAHRASTPQVQGYPTIKWFGENKNSPVDFDGGRDESSLTAYALEKWQMALPPPEVLTLPWCSLPLRLNCVC